jgi:RNA polymerase sigma factor (sigma-70 family)
MKYALLIHSKPGSHEALSVDEQEAMLAEYMALGDDSRCVAAGQLQSVETATTARPGRADADHRRPVCGYQGGVRRLLRVRRRQPRSGDRAGRASPCGAPRRGGGGPAAGGAVALLHRIFRDEWGRVLASLVGFLGDFDLAEEAAQEAFAVAAARWPREGVPANPRAWLTVTARNRAIDRIRRERTLAAKTRQLEVPEATMDELDDTVIEDERLELIFTCCHPALALEAQVALTLRALGGLTTEEIARTFLVSEETMKRRLSRAKAKIKATGIPFAVPAEHRLPDRLDAVLAVVYLIYNEGYSGRIDLAAEAIRLGRVLAALMPDEPEVHGLFALMQIHHARRAARFSGDELVLLEDQDRSLWDFPEIATGRAALERALALRGRGPYALQAAIASLQAEERIDWNQVAALYGQLAQITRSPVIELNRAVAVAQAGSVPLALEIVEQLELDDYRYLHSTRGELLRRLSRTGEAREAFEARSRSNARSASGTSLSDGSPSCNRGLVGAGPP